MAALLKKPSDDRELLGHAIWEYLTEPAGAHRAKRRKIPYAFDQWIAHLTFLEETMQIIAMDISELRSAELDGLILLRAARERFRREYQACAECGAAMRGKICPRCGALRN